MLSLMCVALQVYEVFPSPLNSSDLISCFHCLSFGSSRLQCIGCCNKCIQDCLPNTIDLHLHTVSPPKPITILDIAIWNRNCIALYLDLKQSSVSQYCISTSWSISSVGAIKQYWTCRQKRIRPMFCQDILIFQFYCYLFWHFYNKVVFGRYHHICHQHYETYT